MNPSAVSAGAGPAAGSIVVATLLAIGLYAWTAAALAALLRKAGREPWRGWVPVLNLWTLLGLGGCPGWLALGVLVPGPGTLVTWAGTVVAARRVGASFGYGTAMTVLAAVLLPAWASVLGFGSARWLRRPDVAPPPVPPPPVVPAPSNGERAPAPTAWAWAPASELRRFVPSYPDEHTLPASPADRHGPPATPTVVAAPGPVAAADVVDDPPRAADPPPVSPSPSTPEPPAKRQPDAPADVMADEGVEDTVLTSRARDAWSLVAPIGAPIVLTGRVAILGRRPAVDPEHPDAQLIPIVEETRTVSKRHARLELREDGWWLIDLGSTNGVLLLGDNGSHREAEPGIAYPAGTRFLLGDAEVRLELGPAPGGASR